MRNPLRISTALYSLALVALISGALPASAEPAASPRTVISADADWKFALGDPSGADSPAFNDASWRSLSLPHDWSIEGAPAKDNASGAGGGYFPTGIGWYRKTFNAPASWNGKRICFEFDGVSANATVYLNGEKLGFHPYAYTSFRFDITSRLKLSAKNVLAVRVDNSQQPNSRWYSGSGIYRHVRVIVTGPVHIAPWGVFVSTPELSSASARIVIATQVANDTSARGDFEVKTFLIDPSGAKSPESTVPVSVPSNESAVAKQEIVVHQPSLWSPATPHLYSAMTQILLNGRVLDQVETSFGVRSLAWSVDGGLQLNGQPIKLAGGSVHHDNGLLGAAAFDRAEVRKAELLKGAGFNAVRTAHNPPSPAFLDACDRLGLLVLDEPFDVWTVSKRKYDYAQYFHDWWKQDIDSMVMRDRNHPSIIMWGIGNEIPEVWTPEGAPLARQIAQRVRALDTTRPLTEAFPGATFGPNPDAAIAQVDIAGYNYNLAQNEPEDHKRVPSRIMMTTESFPADAFEQWELVHDHTYILGEFVWTSMDYLGESGIGAWSYGDAKQASQLAGMKAFLRGYLAKMGADGKNPMAPFQNGQPPSALSPEYPWHASDCGDLDLTGFRKPWSYYRDILWNRGDRVFAAVRLPEPEGKKILAAGWAVYPTLRSWTWPGQEGIPLTVEVYSGTERVRLFLNDKLIGEKVTGQGQAFKADFEVPYAPGTLRVEGMRGDRVVARDILDTAGEPVHLKLTPDKTVLAAGGEDLSFITVEAVDANGRLRNDSSANVHFSVSGEGTIAAVGSGDGQSPESYQAQTLRLFQGRALVVIRSTRKAGQMELSASADGIAPQTVTLKAKSFITASELR